jgi:hypothetical protein
MITVNTKKATYPKLMIFGDDWIVEVHEYPGYDKRFIGIHRTGPYTGMLVLDFNIVGGTDYNEPITIQNA